MRIRLGYLTKPSVFGHLDTHPNTVSLGYPEGPGGKSAFRMSNRTPRGSQNQFQNPQIRIIVEVGLGGGDPYTMACL